MLYKEDVKPYRRLSLVLSVVIVILFSALVSSCDKTDAPKVTSNTVAGWEHLGVISDTMGACSLYKTTDKENGATIYVVVGHRKAGLFVLPKETQ